MRLTTGVCSHRIAQCVSKCVRMCGELCVCVCVCCELRGVCVVCVPVYTYTCSRAVIHYICLAVCHCLDLNGTPLYYWVCVANQCCYTYIQCSRSIQYKLLSCVYSAHLLALRLHLALGTHSETNHLLAWDIVIERLFFQPASLCVCVCVCVCVT